MLVLQVEGGLAGGVLQVEGGAGTDQLLDRLETIVVLDGLHEGGLAGGVLQVEGGAYTDQLLRDVLTWLVFLAAYMRAVSPRLFCKSRAAPERINSCAMC